MLMWQFGQPRATVPRSEVEVVRPVGRPAAWLGWLVWLWHSWQRNGGRAFRRLAMTVPCGWWQMAQFSCTGAWLCRNGPRFSMWHVKQVSLTLSLTSWAGLSPCTLWHDEQVILPSMIGWCTGRLTCARCSLWQVKQTSVCVRTSRAESRLAWGPVSRTASRALWILWQELQATSRFACTLAWKAMRLPPWWQVRQAALRSAIGVVDDLPNVRSGWGRSFAPDGFWMWFSLSPWQFVQVGVRPSAFVPWRVCPMARSWGESSSLWQRVHFASPVRTRSARGGFASAGCWAKAS